MVDIRPMVARGFDLWSPQIITTTASGSAFGKGTIELENNWQLCAVPVEFGYYSTTQHELIHDSTTVAKFKNYILDQINDLYGEGLIEVANAYIGDLNSFYSYVPESTPESSPHNFSLIYTDGVNKEITGFWIKSVATSPMTISWGE